MTTLAEESALLSELDALAERGRHQDVLDRLDRLPPETLEGRTRFALLAAEAHGRLGAHAQAHRWAKLALTVARSRGERAAELRARHYEGAIALRRADVDDAEQQFAVALDMARGLADHAAQARCFNNLGIIAFLRGDPEAALAEYQLALAAYQQAGMLRGMAETYHNIGISLRERADYGRALAATDQAIRLANEVKDESLVALVLTGRAETHLMMGDDSLAAAELARAADAYQRVRLESGLAEVWRVQAAVARARNESPEAVRLLTAAAELARHHGSAEVLADIERDLGAALAAGGDPVGSRAARERAIEIYRRLGARKQAANLAALLA